MKRPELYVPLSVRFATGKTGTRIVQEFGAAGLGVWACTLATWKLGNPPGQFQYASEAEGWQLLGLAGCEPRFTLEEFYTLTGRIKQTRRTRVGRVTNVKSTRWERWNDELRTQSERERKARYRAQSDWDKGGTPGGTMSGHVAPQIQSLEREIEPSDQIAPTTTPRSALSDITQARPTSDVPGAQRILDQCDVFEGNTVGVIEGLCIQVAHRPAIAMLVEQELQAIDTRTIKRSKTALAVRLLQDAVARVVTKEIA